MSDMNAPLKTAVPAKAKPTESVENHDLAAGRRVLQLESRARWCLAQELDVGFTRAVDILDCAKGRIVVSGMG